MYVHAHVLYCIYYTVSTLYTYSTVCMLYLVLCLQNLSSVLLIYVLNEGRVVDVSACKHTGHTSPGPSLLIGYSSTIGHNINANTWRNYVIAC